jgi:hypothetical protein
MAALLLITLGLISPTVPVDTLPVEPRLPASSLIEKYKQDAVFQYETPAPESAWDEFWWWVNQWLRELFATKEYEIASNIFTYTLCAAVILYIIIKLTQTDLRSLFYRNVQTPDLDLELATENPMNLSLDELINECARTGDYRRAVRYLYLQVLKQLSEKNLILWRIDKTNRDYLAELSATPHKESFASLTEIFDYIWYGDFTADRAAFDNAKHHFDAFQQRLNTVNRS